MKQLPLVALLYVVFGSLGVLLVAPIMPPFQNPDEQFHLFRADQLSHFVLLAKKLPDSQQGGQIESGLPQAAAEFAGVLFHPGNKVSREMWLSAPRRWGHLEPTDFSDTAIYPPFLYLPAAAALDLGRALHLTVLHGVMLARMATGAAAIVVGVVAVALAELASLWIYSLLLLPMSLMLIAAASQDALMLSCTALAAALCFRMRQRASNIRMGAAVLLLALIGMARPPYGGFALVLLAAQASLRVRLAGIALVLAAVLGWAFLNAPHIALPVFGPGGWWPEVGTPNPAAQARGLMLAPWRLISLLSATWRAYGWQVLLGFIGKVGWMGMDARGRAIGADLPLAYHAAAWVLLGMTCLLVFAGAGPPRLRLAEWAGLVGILTACLGVILILYLTFTIPGATVVEGIQGRYFIPPALMLGSVLVPARPTAVPASWVLRGMVAARWVVLLFPVITLPVLLYNILLQYYI